VRNFILVHKYYWADKIKENEVGGHVVRMGEERNVYKVLVGKPERKRRDHLEDLGVGGRMGSKCILGRLVGVV
jgi:hypothetical protein